MVFFLFDPLYVLLSLIGYFFMFFIALYIAPRFASKLSGRLSLYASMILLAFSTIITFSLVVTGFIYLMGIDGIYYFSTIAVLILLSNILVYLFSPLMIDLAFSVRKDDYLQRIVDEVKEKVGLKGKVLALRAKGLPNAFAYGNFIFGKRVAVTDSLIEMLDEEELKSVIGHEIGHHKHKDSIFILLFGILPSIIYYLGYTMIWSNIRDRRNRNGFLTLFGLILVLISFLVQLLVLAFSRLREYYADYVGAKYVSKSGMQYALAKLFTFYSNDRYREAVRKSTYSTLFIYALANPLVSRIDIESIKNSPIREIEFLSTHPPIQKRLKFIDQIV